MERQKKHSEKEKEFISFSLRDVALALSFLLVNAIAAMIQPEMAAVMSVSSIFLLYESGAVDKPIALFVALFMIIAVSMSAPEVWYPLVIHCFFYMAVLMTYKSDRSLYCNCQNW